MDQGKPVNSSTNKDPTSEDELIDNLVKKLKESVAIVGDLTKLLKSLPPECTLEYYYEKIAE